MQARFSWKVGVALFVMSFFLVFGFQNCSSKFKNNLAEEPVGKISKTSGGFDPPLNGALTVDYFAINHLGPYTVNPGMTLNIRIYTSNATSIKGLIMATGSCPYKTQAGLSSWIDWPVAISGDSYSGQLVIPNDTSHVGCTFNYCVTAYNSSNSSSAPKTVASENSKCSSFEVKANDSTTPNAPTMSYFTLLGDNGQNLSPGQTLKIEFSAANATSFKGKTRATGSCPHLTANPNNVNWIDWVYTPFANPVPPVTFTAANGSLSYSGTYLVPPDGTLNGCAFEYCITAYNASNASEAAKTASSSNSICTYFLVPIDSTPVTTTTAAPATTTTTPPATTTTAASTTSCKITLNDCPNYPSHQLGEFTEAAVPEANSDQGTCYARAGQYAQFCGNSSPVFSSYYVGSTKVVTGAAIRCESWNYSPTYCYIGRTISNLGILQQISTGSKGSCYGKFSIYAGNHVYVNDGCRGIFVMSAE